jgi:Zn-dependent M28 family amino/carboxypeptidase
MDVTVPLSADHLLHIDINAQEKTLTARNVVGIIPGTTVPDSNIIICAHYDHLGALGPKVYFPGANDNASGVATLLQLAKDLQKHPLRYTVVVIAFAAEEAGLLGSKHLVENYEALMGKPLKHSAFVLNLDLLSAGDKGGMLVNATEAPKAYQLLLKINEQGGYLPVLKGRGPAANSDHYWFYKAGIPALFFYTMGGTPYYHHVNDTWQNLTLTHCRPVQELLTQFLFQYSGTSVPKR